MTANTEASAKTSLALKLVSCIRYPVQFYKDQIETGALINFGSEVNVMTPTYIAKLGLRYRPINFGA